MGNETSLPEGAADDFEEQAKAPPTAIDPSGGSAPPQQQQPQQTSNNTRGPRPGARMIGAVFGKSSGSSPMRSEKGPPPQQLQQQQQQHQNVYYTEHVQDGNSTPNGNPYMQGPPHHHGGPPAGYPTDPTQQQYYAQQQQQYYMQQQQQQQQRQAYYGNPNQMPPHQPDYPPPHHMQQPQHPQQQQQQAPENNHNEKPTSKKSLFRGQASARGAALISSMRNLSLGGALRGGNSNNQGKKEVQDWEKQWDEDEDDDSDEEEMPSGRQGGPLGGHMTATTTAPPQLHAIRPGMDTGHSDASHPHVSTPTSDSKPHFVTPDTVYDAPASPKHQQRAVVNSAPNSPNYIPESDDDALEWDTGHDDSKPNMQMFMPMLRVLGKGSFGKVRIVQRSRVFAVFVPSHSLCRFQRLFLYKNVKEKNAAVCLR